MRQDFDDETQLVLLLSAPISKSDEAERLQMLARGTLDWNRVLGMLMLHRTAAQAWTNLVDHLDRVTTFRPFPALALLRTIYRGQRLYVREQIARNVILVKQFDDAGIRCAILKGSAVARMGYRHLGARIFADNDFLFDREHIATVGSILKDSGYIQGDWDPALGAVKPASRSQVLLHPVTSHETYPYDKATPEAAILENHCIDVHFSVDLMTANRNDDAVRDLLARRVRIEGNDLGHLWALSQEDMFVFLCVHFNREATNRREAESLRDLLLCKMVDLLVLLDNRAFPIDLSLLVKRAWELGFEREVFYGLTYLSALYPNRVPDNLVESFRPAGQTDFLHQIFHDGKPVHTWVDSITERFFNPRRVIDLVE